MSRLMVPGQQNIGPYGEELFRRYLDCHRVSYKKEPNLTETKKRLDFELTTDDGERVFVEVKTIYNPPPHQHSGAFYHDAYSAIRDCLQGAFRQFTDLPDTLNVIALAAFPGSLIDLSTPQVMLGAMYGDTAFSFPFDTHTGKSDPDNGTNIFVAGKGPMIRRANVPRHTRISAVLSLHNSDNCMLDLPEQGTLTITDVANQAIAKLRSSAANAPSPYVTCWDNAAAKSVLPHGIFAGPMDQRWSVENGEQLRVFTGAVKLQMEQADRQYKANREAYRRQNV